MYLNLNNQLSIIYLLERFGVSLGSARVCGSMLDREVDDRGVDGRGVDGWEVDGRGVDGWEVDGRGVDGWEVDKGCAVWDRGVDIILIGDVNIGKSVKTVNGSVFRRHWRLHNIFYRFINFL